MLRLVLLLGFLLCLLHFGASLSFHEGGLIFTVPLKSLHVQGEFFDSFGEVILKQVWTNNHVNPITSKYKFSLDTSAVVSGFVMKIGNQSWTGVVNEKSIARENFGEAVASGIKSSILEKISDTEYQVEIGPIPPYETAEIEFHYLTHAAVQLDGSYRFVLPTNIAPKYINPFAAKNQVDKEYAERMASTPYTSQPPYTFDVDLTWRTGSALRGIVSATNEIHTEILSATAVRVRCTTAPENGDFSLVVTTASTTGTYSYQNEEGTTFLYVHNQIPTEVVTSTVNAKKITIVVDRSGSMAWQKISEAVAAIDEFLSLLPPNPHTLINVVSFGSHFDALYSNSVPATVENIDKIRHSVRTFQASYGGTELSECLKAVVAGSALPSGTATDPLPESSYMEHAIVLLTDGQVYDVHAIMTHLDAQKTTTNFRIMSVGIGRDADRKLVEQVADTTHGLSRMLTDETDLTRALTDILAYIDKQYYTDVKVLDYEASQCSQVLYPAHPVDMFLRLSPAQYQQVVANGLTISAKDPVHRGSMKVWHLSVEKTVKVGRLLEKLYADHTISQLSKKIQYLGGDRFNLHPEIAHLTESIVALSVKHGIMNKHTSFLVVSDVKIDMEQHRPEQHVEVPQHEDYPYGTVGGGVVLLAMGGSTGASGGSISLSSGAGAIASSGNVRIADDSSSSDMVGSILLATGSATTGLSLHSSAGSAGDGGNINLIAGAGSSAGVSGEVTISSGSSPGSDAVSFTGTLLTSSGTSSRHREAVIVESTYRSDNSGSIVFTTGVASAATVTIATGASSDASGGMSAATGSLSDPGFIGDVPNVHGGTVTIVRGSSVKPGQAGEIKLGSGSVSSLDATLGGLSLDHGDTMHTAPGAILEVGDIGLVTGSFSDFSSTRDEISTMRGGGVGAAVVVESGSGGSASVSGVATVGEVNLSGFAVHAGLEAASSTIKSDSIEIGSVSTDSTVPPPTSLTSTTALPRAASWETSPLTTLIPVLICCAVLLMLLEVIYDRLGNK